MDKEAQARLGMVEELRRRKVLRSTTLYAVSSWCLLQWATLSFDMLGLPEWSVSLLLTAIVLGFPVVVALSWAFDVTPQGVRRSDPDEIPLPPPTLASRIINITVTLLVAGTVAMLALG